MLAWTVIDWFKSGKPTAIGAISGAVAGLVAITPAAGFVTPMSALVIGIVGGAACYFMVSTVKHIFGYDDTLDVFGIHGVGGAAGALLTGVLATSVINPVFKDPTGNTLAVGLIDGNLAQVGNQLAAIGIAIILASVGTFIVLKVVDLLIGLRVTPTEEIEGLDATQHGERAYAFSEESIVIEAEGSYVAEPSQGIEKVYAAGSMG
jgi:Amt family ammonium transporter